MKTLHNKQTNLSGGKFCIRRNDSEEESDTEDQCNNNKEEIYDTNIQEQKEYFQSKALEPVNVNSQCTECRRDLLSNHNEFDLVLSKSSSFQCNMIRERKKTYTTQTFDGIYQSKLNEGEKSNKRCKGVYENATSRGAYHEDYGKVNLRKFGLSKNKSNSVKPDNLKQSPFTSVVSCSADKFEIKTKEKVMATQHSQIEVLGNKMSNSHNFLNNNNNGLYRSNNSKNPNKNGSTVIDSNSNREKSIDNAINDHNLNTFQLKNEEHIENKEYKNGKNEDDYSFEQNYLSHKQPIIFKNESTNDDNRSNPLINKKILTNQEIGNDIQTLMKCNNNNKIKSRSNNNRYDEKKVLLNSKKKTSVNQLSSKDPKLNIDTSNQYYTKLEHLKILNQSNAMKEQNKLSNFNWLDSDNKNNFIDNFLSENNNKVLARNKEENNEYLKFSFQQKMLELFQNKRRYNNNNYYTENLHKDNEANSNKLRNDNLSSSDSQYNIQSVNEFPFPSTFHFRSSYFTVTDFKLKSKGSHCASKSIASNNNNQKKQRSFNEYCSWIWPANEIEEANLQLLKLKMKKLQDSNII